MNTKEYTLNYGPQHPSAHGVLRLLLSLDGEIVTRAEPHIGLLHRGTEKLIEHKTYMQALPYFDRLDYVAPLCQEHAFALAVEKLLGIEPPLKSQYIRVLLAEMSRIQSHLLNVTTMALDIGSMSPLLWGFEEREELMSLCERITGARLHAAYFCPGGVQHDIPADVFPDIRSFISSLPNVLDHMDDVLTHNPIFKQRTVDIGAISLAEAIEWGFTGPLLRASGGLWDIRKTFPYDVYGLLNFSVPVGTYGDCYDRFVVRMQEMRQSLHIIDQCLEPCQEGGPVQVNNPKITPPKRHDINHVMESLIHHFKLYTEGFSVPEGDTYVSVEAPKGEFGVFLVADGSPRPYRCKIRAPSFAALQAFDALATDHTLADVSAILGSLDIVLGEIDR